MIMPGVKIDKGAIIGAMAGNITFDIVAGNQLVKLVQIRFLLWKFPIKKF